MTTYYPYWGGDTGTTELPSWKRGAPRTDTTPIVVIDGKVAEPEPTREVGFPWSTPTVTRYRHVPGWRRLARRLCRSRFAADVRECRWVLLGAVAALGLLHLANVVHELAPLATVGWN